MMNEKVMLAQSMKAQPGKRHRLLKQDCIFTRSVCFEHFPPERPGK